MGLMSLLRGKSHDYSKDIAQARASQRAEYQKAIENIAKVEGVSTAEAEDFFNKNRDYIQKNIDEGKYKSAVTLKDLENIEKNPIYAAQRKEREDSAKADLSNSQVMRGISKSGKALKNVLSLSNKLSKEDFDNRFRLANTMNQQALGDTLRTESEMQGAYNPNSKINLRNNYMSAKNTQLGNIASTYGSQVSDLQKAQERADKEQTGFGGALNTFGSGLLGNYGSSLGLSNNMIGSIASGLPLMI